jgi:hypothetical protein
MGRRDYLAWHVASVTRQSGWKRAVRARAVGIAYLLALLSGIAFWWFVFVVVLSVR